MSKRAGIVSGAFYPKYQQHVRYVRYFMIREDIGELR